MGIAKGLKAMEQAMNSSGRVSSDAGGMKVRWLKLEDNQSKIGRAHV